MNPYNIKTSIKLNHEPEEPRASLCTAKLKHFMASFLVYNNIKTLETKLALLSVGELSKRNVHGVVL